MKYKFSAKYRKNVNTSTVYDQHGRFFVINEKTARIVESLFEPKSVEDLKAASYASNDEIDKFMIWALKHNFIEVNRKNDNVTYSNSIYYSPTSVAIYPTFNCNQQCIFCYTDSGPHKKDGKELSKDKWKKIIQRIIHDGVTSITILGGEPFLDEELILEILELCKDQIFVRIFTNGTAKGGISKELAQRLSAYPDCEIIFSIHGNKPELHNQLVGNKNAFNLLLQSAQNILKYSTQIVSAGTAVTNYNVHLIPEIAVFLANEGFMSYDVKPFSPSARVSCFSEMSPSPIVLENSIKKALEALEQMNSDMYLSFSQRHTSNLKLNNQIGFWGLQDAYIGGCAGDNEANIDPYGNVYRCPFVIGKKEYVVFNLLEDSFEDNWKNIYWKYSRPLGWESDPCCKTCEYLQRCLGGCPYLAEVAFHTLEYGDPYCPKVYKYHQQYS